MIEGNGARPSHLGPGFAESDTMYTVNTVDRHSVAYPELVMFDGMRRHDYNRLDVCPTLETHWGTGGGILH